MGVLDIVVSHAEPGSIAAIGKRDSPVAERVRQARQTVPTRGLIVKRHGRAAEAGATVEIEPSDQFYGERSGVFRDPFGHRWNVGHHLEELSPDEMQRRDDSMLAGR